MLCERAKEAAALKGIYQAASAAAAEHALNAFARVRRRSVHLYLITQSSASPYKRTSRLL